MADFGTDVSSFPDLDPTFTEISGARVVAEAVLRRLQTRPGVIDDLPNDGIDLIAILNASITPTRLRFLEQRIQQEAEQDERVLSADVAVSQSQTSGAVSVKITLDTNDGPFDLALEISAVSLEVISAGNT